MSLDYLRPFSSVQYGVRGFRMAYGAAWRTTPWLSSPTQSCSLPDRSHAAEGRQEDGEGGRSLALITACSAPHASAWKRAAPTQPLTTLLDRQYRIAARFNLGLKPFSSDHQLPADCPLCTKSKGAVAKDPWHYLICKSQSKRKTSTRHNAVVDALYHAVLLTGGQAQREVNGLQADSWLRPDLQIV